ncbi:MAG: hypothetical protein V3U53_08195 [bacterium]
MPAASDTRKSPVEYILKRLRKEYGLEFIFTDLSERVWKKVLENAGLMRDWEKGRQG